MYQNYNKHLIEKNMSQIKFEFSEKKPKKNSMEVLVAIWMDQAI